ncbi:unnamed protein product [Leptosia nina]|uniref:Uncharacterized protein n=1 Tax=Leptosia nina TaxID=320188 RepID=A0AAV1JYH8_9NEOP
MNTVNKTEFLSVSYLVQVLFHTPHCILPKLVYTLHRFLVTISRRNSLGPAKKHDYLITLRRRGMTDISYNRREAGFIKENTLFALQKAEGLPGSG